MALHCEIVVQGRIDRRPAPVVGAVEVAVVDDDSSTLVGDLPDHAALRGLLSELDDLGYALVSVDTDRV